MNKDFAKGMIVSMALKALPVRKKSPIAYLYNGVRLPALPEWDREMYPYAYINYIEIFGTKYYTLYFFKSLYYGTSSDGSYNFYGTDIMTSELTNGAWGAMTMKGTSVIDEVGWEQAVWTNVDILYEDGSVGLAASTPIPIYNEPTEYLYNGVRLPKLPEWDKTVYPYAFMRTSKIGTTARAYVYILPSVTYSVNSNGEWLIVLPSGYMGTSIPYNTSTGYGDNTWSDCVVGTGSGIIVEGNGINWTNFDIKNADDSVFLSASEPVPIYE